MKQIVSVSLSTAEATMLGKLARRNNTTRTGIVREALRQYEFRTAWDRVRQWGQQTALEFGITSYDDVDRIAGKR